LNCLSNCTTGSTPDAYGCNTCNCISTPPPTCSSVACTIACSNGYAVDANGCYLCQCATTVCPAIACASTTACAYGAALDSNGCTTCNCNPCPNVLCTLVCSYGFANDPTSGCPTCNCNPTPLCDPTAVPAVNADGSVNTSTPACNLACANGFSTVNGCTSCQCATAPPCVCGARPSNPIKCSDQKTISDYSVCSTANNNCTWVRNPCPIGIEVTIPPGGNFTTSDLKTLCSNYRITSANYNFTVSVLTNGTVVVIIWIAGDSVPAGTTPQNVATAVQASAVSNGNTNAYAFVIGTPGSTSSSSASSIILSLFAIFVVLFSF